MSHRYIKPSANKASLQVLGGILGLLFGYYGFYGRVPAGTPMPKDVQNFALVWFFICAATIVIGLVNMFSKRGIPTDEIVTEDDEIKPNEQPDVEERLRRLVRLHDEHLITDEEFERKRTEILNERW